MGETKKKLTEKRMPIPVKMAEAGWETCKSIKYQIRNEFNHVIFETCQTNTASDDSRKREQDIDRGIQPLRQFVIGTTRLVEVGNLFVKYFDDGIWGMTVLEFVEQRMGTEIFLGLLFVGFDGIVEDELIV